MELLMEFFSRYSQKLALLSTILLVVLITLSAADMGIFVLDQLSQPDSVQIPDNSAKTSSTTGNTMPSYNITSMNLFGVVAAQGTGQPVEAPETKLKLELQGVFTSELPERASAIVAQPGKDGVLYFPGDRLPGNAILSSIFDDHILLKRGDGFESLKFSDDAFRSGSSSEVNYSDSEDDSAAAVPRSMRRGARGRRQPVTDDEEDDPLPAIPAPTRMAQPSSLSDFVTQNRKKIDEDPASLLSEMGINSITSGETEGYQLSGDLPDEILRRSGLQRGDTILSVNGQAVGDVAQDSALIDAAMAEGQIRVEVQREDRRFFVTVPVH